MRGVYVGADVVRVWLAQAHRSSLDCGKVMGPYCEYATCPEVQVCACSANRVDVVSAVGPGAHLLIETGPVVHVVSAIGQGIVVAIAVSPRVFKRRIFWLC